MKATKYILIALFTAGTTLGAYAEDTTKERDGERRANRFERFDKDGDGKLSPKERKHARNVREKSENGKDGKKRTCKKGGECGDRDGSGRKGGGHEAGGPRWRTGRRQPEIRCGSVHSTGIGQNDSGGFFYIFSAARFSASAFQSMQFFIWFMDYLRGGRCSILETAFRLSAVKWCYTSVRIMLHLSRAMQSILRKGGLKLLF